MHQMQDLLQKVLKRLLTNLVIGDRRMFQVIGERINTSRKKVQAAVVDRDADYITKDVKMQQEAGADFIDFRPNRRIQIDLPHFSPFHLTLHTNCKSN